jgi:muramoyltetrapeptide carboxypeptidase
MKVTVIAPCGPADPERLDRGTERLRRLGFEVHVHPQCAATAPFTAGSDEVRFEAFMDAANDPTADVVWCARGGYGATRLLPMLQNAHRPPPKTLVGYSDVTALHAFVQDRWGWRAVHGPMPAAKQEVPDEDWQAMADVVRGGKTAPVKLAVITPPAGPIEAPLVGGNLSVWNCLTGTPWQPETREKLLFLEDINEEGYNVDRMVTQLSQAAGIRQAVGIVLGSFTRGAEAEDLREVFLPLGLPAVMGHHAGHGGRCPPVLLNRTHRLEPDGTLTCV